MASALGLGTAAVRLATFPDVLPAVLLGVLLAGLAWTGLYLSALYPML
jgi:hypothetical protein